MSHYTTCPYWSEDGLGNEYCAAEGCECYYPISNECYFTEIDEEVFR